MLSHWGQALFCYWAVILSIRAIVLFVADGFVRYIVNQYNILFHTAPQEASTILNGGIAFLLTLSAILLLGLGIIFSLFPSLSQTLFAVGAAAISTDTLVFCLLMYIAAAAMQNVQRMYAACNEARGRVAQNMAFEVLLIVCEIVGLLLLSMGRFDFKAALALDSILIFGLTLAFLLYLRHRYPLSGLRYTKSIGAGAQSFAKATKLYAYNFFEKMSSDGLVVLLSFYRFDKAAIALFTTVRTIVNTPILAQNLLQNTYTPNLQAAFALRDTSALQQLLRFIRLGVGGVLLLGIVLCLPLYKPVFTLWTKGSIDYNASFLLLMLMMVVGQLLGLSYTFILKGLNALNHTLGLMLAKTICIVIGLVWSRQQLLPFATVLVWVEILSALFVLPALAHHYLQQSNIIVSKRADWLEYIPYAVSVLILWLYYIAN